MLLDNYPAPQYYINVATSVLGAAIVLSSAQWYTAIHWKRLDVLFGWGPRKRWLISASLFLRFAGGTCLLFLAQSDPLSVIALLLIFVSSLTLYRFMQPILTAVFRMLHILTGILLVGSVFDAHTSALYLIAGVSILSYLVTGITKIIRSGWRNGETLLRILNSRTNGWSVLYHYLKQRKTLLQALSWGVILFECLAPLLLLAGPWGAILFCSISATFHLTLAFVMGMNLFPLTWGATYPAIIFASASIADATPIEVNDPVLVWMVIWFFLLIVWQFVAWIPKLNRIGKYGLYLLLYEFYMFAFRIPDHGVRYQVIHGDGTISQKKDPPLPWRRRLMDGLWNPEHEIKKMLRHLAYVVNCYGSNPYLQKRIEAWLHTMVKIPSTGKLAITIYPDDSFEATEREKFATVEPFSLK